MDANQVDDCPVLGMDEHPWHSSLPMTVILGSSEEIVQRYMRLAGHGWSGAEHGQDRGDAAVPRQAEGCGQAHYSVWKATSAGEQVHVPGDSVLWCVLLRAGTDSSRR